MALLALRGEFLLKGSFWAGLGLFFGDLLGFSNVSAPMAGLAFVFAWFGAVLPPQVLREVGGNLGASFGEDWFGVCFGLGVFALLGVLFRTGECGMRDACLLLTVLTGDGAGSRAGRRLLLGESLFSWETMHSGLARLDLSSALFLRLP